MIELREITVRFGDKLVLDRFSLQLPERGVLCLSGASGCGKTTLTRVLSFLQKPESGEVLGLKSGESAVLFQEDRILPWYSVRRNLEAVVPPEEALRWLERVELASEADSMPEALSGGMLRRVAFARALAFPGKLLILDEPFKGMDLALKERLYPLVREQAALRPILLITHEADEMQALADRVLRLDGPPLRIIEDETEPAR